MKALAKYFIYQPRYCSSVSVITVFEQICDIYQMISNFLNSFISTSNHMFGRAIWDKLHEHTFGNFEIAQVKGRQFDNFQKLQRLKNRLNQACDYWLMTPN